MTLSPISPDDPVGNPSYPAQFGALRGQMRIMFLGGPLDHAIRQVRHHPDHPDRPEDEVYRYKSSRTRWMNGTIQPDPPDLVYSLHKVDVGTHAWFCYLLEGYSPSKGALLDTNPYPII